MRPDEDYAEMDEPRSVGGSRAMSWMVLAVAVGGFAALAYYAYHSGTKSTQDGETLVVEADKTPLKEAPANPDGEQFPDKDKTIYDVIAPNGEAKTGEKLMPEPEHPVAAANTEDSEDEAPIPSAPVAAVAPAAAPATTFVANAEPAKAKTPDAVPVATPVAQTVTEQPVATVAKPIEAAPAKPEVKSYAAPHMVNEKTLTAKKETAKPVVKAESKPKPAANPKVEKAAASAPVAGGAYTLQLGAFKSDAEAQASWKKISAAHAGVLKGSPTVVKADVNGTTFYRLRAGHYASSDAAKAACAKLSGQACFPVK